MRDHEPSMCLCCKIVPLVKTSLSDGPHYFAIVVRFRFRILERHMTFLEHSFSIISSYTLNTNDEVLNDTVNICTLLPSTWDEATVQCSDLTSKQ